MKTIMKTCSFCMCLVLFLSCGKEPGGGVVGPPLTGGLNPNLESQLLVPAIISDNMVFQQDTDAIVWGKAVPGSKISVRPSWTSEKYETLTASDGTWSLTVKTPAASSQTYIMDIIDSQRKRIRVSNILVGEVWHCSGQSNMEMPMRGFGSVADGNFQPVKDSEKELVGADFPEFRYFKVRYAELDKASQGKVFDVREGCSWQVCTPENAREYSAIAFFFGRKLHEETGFPVGMIGCSYGGTPIAAWMPDQQVPVPEEKSSPGILYNGMVWPVLNYSKRGILWYQGESDKYNEAYTEDMVTLVSKWRRDMGDTDAKIPFYYVQIAPYGSSDKLLGPKTMERQFAAMSLIPASGIVSTSDVGEQKQIHYSDKRTPAERLWLWAARYQYGMENIDPQGPTFKAVDFSGDKAVVSFDHADMLSCSAENIPWVEIAGEDKVFHPAEAVIGPEPWQMSVSSGKVQKPVAVRYCFSSWHVGSLYNQAGLPAYPFRTDNW